jgi:hypothetical protein
MGKPTSSGNASSAGPCGRLGVDSGRDRRLVERARVLGFESLRGYVQARCDAGASVPGIAAELGVGDWQVQAALARFGVRLAPRLQRLAAQRRRYTRERIAARVAALGFADVHEYLVDRVIEQAWLRAEVAAELGADGAAAAGPPWDPPGAAHARRAGGGRVGASGVGGGVAGASGGAAGGAGFPRSGRLPICTARRAGVVGEADAGRAWGRSQMAGGGSWPGWGCNPDPKVRRWPHRYWQGSARNTAARPRSRAARVTGSQGR